MSLFPLVFGEPPTKAESSRVRREARPARMRTIYGIGPEGARCGDCVHLIGRQFAKTYYKCRWFGNTGGPATDWCKSYAACGKFQNADLGTETSRNG